MYRFEHKISTQNAGQPGGRLAYAGLSGGFGTITFGQIWSASYNGTGAITDGSWRYGNSHTSLRVGNALSYSNSVGNASLQIDAIMDPDRDTGDAVDQIEFGMTIGLGDIGKLAVSYVESKDTKLTTTMEHVPAMEAKAATADTPEMYYIRAAGEDRTKDVEVKKVDVVIVADSDQDSETALENTYFKVVDGVVTDEFKDDQEAAFKNALVLDSSTGNPIISVDTDSDTDGVQLCKEDANTVAMECKTVTVYVETKTSYVTEDEATNTPGVSDKRLKTDVTYHILEKGEDAGKLRVAPEKDGDPMMPYVPASTKKLDDIMPGHKGSHIAVEFGLGGVSAWLGHSTVETNGGAIDMGTKAAPNTDKTTGGVVDATMMTDPSETKVVHAGVRGSVGDSGLNYDIAYRSVDTDGDKSNPYMIHLSKSLGDGASVHAEHGNSDDGTSGLTWVGLKVDF